MSGTRRTVLRIAAIPLMLNVGWGHAGAADAKSGDNVDTAALARSIDLDPKLSRCTVSKERKGKGLENLLKVLKDGKPPAIARAVYRWKQQRIAGETRKTPKFIFGSKTGSDKDAKIAIMSDEYDSVSWGPTFDDKGGKALYEKFGKAVKAKSDDTITSQMNPMLTGMRQALELTGKDELITWGQEFSNLDLAAVSQQVIATQEPQEAEIADGVKLEIGMQTYTSRQLYAYMHPVYDPGKNALSCDKLEDSLPVSTEHQLYIALTGIQEDQDVEVAEATDLAPGEVEAQGDADIIDGESDVIDETDVAEADVDGEGNIGSAIDEEIGLAEGGGDPAEEVEVAALDPSNDSDVDEQEVASVDEDAIEEDEEDYSDVVDAEEETFKAKPRPRRRAPRRDYYEEPVRTIDYDPVEVVEDCEDYVDDWYDHPGYYDDYGYTQVYFEPILPPIFIRPPVIITPVISLFGGVVVFAAVTRPRWRRPLWTRPLFARRGNRIVNNTININFFRPNRPRLFKPGWGLNQNRGFVRRKATKRAIKKARLIRAKAKLGNKKRKGALGRAGLFKPKNKKAAKRLQKLRKKKAARKALAAKKAGKKFAPKRAAAAKRKAAARKKALAKKQKKAALANKKGGKKGAAAKARKAKAKKALAKKKAAAAKKNGGNKKALAAKRAKAKKAAARKKARLAAKKQGANKAAAKQRAAAKKKAAAAKKRAAAKQKGAAGKKRAAANKKAAAARKAAARKKAAAAKRKAASGKKKAAANKRRAAAKRKAAARKKGNANKAAARRRANQAKKRANQQARKRANKQSKKRANQQARKRANKQVRARKKGRRGCPPGKRRVKGKGCR